MNEFVPRLDLTGTFSHNAFGAQGRNMSSRMKRVIEAVDRNSNQVEVNAIREAVLGWHAHSGRSLPWRDDRHDPYRVLVSEMMLVQTTVSAVIPYYHKFLNRFPTVESLAIAPESEVLKHWEGLGYYRRARQLHQMAREVTDRFGGRIPTDEAELLSLPGVGRYIAGAVRSFAFEQPAPILEANTIRLLARLTGTKEEVTSGSAQKRLWATAESLVSPDEPGTFNQALMDLGAEVCTPKNPDCTHCPIADFCVANREGLTDSIPVRLARKPPTPGEEAAIVLTRDSDRSILLLERPETGLWASFWELPTFWISGADPARRASLGASVAHPEELPQAIHLLFGLEPDRFVLAPKGTVNYVVTRYKMSLQVIFGSVRETGHRHDTPHCPDGWKSARFVNHDDMKKLTMPSAHRKVLKKMDL